MSKEDIKKISAEEPLSKSKDIVQENIDKLKALFPEVTTEGKIDFDALKEILGEEAETGEEYYRFTWAGKSQARREAHKPSTGTLRPAKDESVDWDNTKNLYIEGDNLEVLKLLQKSYAGKVKMIYIDPPYNTGKDFVYKDNYKDNLQHYKEVTGQVDSEGRSLSTNSDSDGRYHSNWLNMMYPRLRLARNLLNDDGLIFISIADHEFENLMKVTSEIFSRENLIASICHKSRASISNDKIISSNHNHLLLFAKNERNIYKNRYQYGVAQDLDSFRQLDDKGYYKLTPVDGPGGARKGNPYYSFQGISGFWRYSFERMTELYDKNELVVNKGSIQRKSYKTAALGKQKTISTWWDKGFLTSNGTKELDKLMGGKYFDNPKNLSLLARILEFSNTKGTVILDFFSGSATTAHAVMQLNAEDGGKRQHIQVQLPEPTDPKSEAYKAGYKNIAEIGKERIRRAAKKIAEEHPEKAKEMDLGFKVFKLDSSNINAWEGDPEKMKENLFDAVENIKPERSEEDVLYEILLKYGLDLTLPIEERSIAGKPVFNVGMGALFLCLADGITAQVAEGIGQWKEELDPATCRVVFKDNGFTDVEKTNAAQVLKRYGVTEVRSV